jgi:glucokinase
MNPTEYPRLLGDIGGTNARFAWQAGPDAPLTDVATYPCVEHESLLHAMRHYLSQFDRPAPQQCAIGIANPIVGDQVRMTNHHWAFSISEMQHALGLKRFLVINDFTALALSLPSLAPQDLRAVGGGHAVPNAPLGLLGPGTGLGVSGLLPAVGGRSAIPINGEGGHVTLAPTNELEEKVVRILRAQFGHPSAERALSGSGLVNLYTALCQIDGVAARTLTPAELTAQCDTDKQCGGAIELFFSLLGNVAGNLALSLGARGGMYIGGGIVPRLGDRIDRSAFRARFEDKGRFRGYLEDIPIWVVNARMSPALIGAARALVDL